MANAELKAIISADASKFFGELGKVKLTTGKVLGVVGAAASAAAAGWWMLAQRTAEYSEQILKAAAMTGLTTDEVQDLSAAAETLELDTETMTEAFARFHRTVGSGGKSVSALRAIGLSASSIKNAGGIDGFVSALEGLAKVENEFARAKLAKDIFGKGSEALLPVIRNAKELRKTIESVRQLNIRISPEDLEKADQFGDKMKLVSISLKTASAAAMADSMQQAAQYAQQFAQWIASPEGKQMVQDLKDVMGGIAATIRFLAPAVSASIKQPAAAVRMFKGKYKDEFARGSDMMTASPLTFIPGMVSAGGSVANSWLQAICAELRGLGKTKGLPQREK